MHVLINSGENNFVTRVTASFALRLRLSHFTVCRKNLFGSINCFRATSGKKMKLKLK